MEKIEHVPLTEEQKEDRAGLSSERTPSSGLPQPGRNNFPDWKDLLSIFGVYFLMEVIIALVVSLGGWPLEGPVMFFAFGSKFCGVIIFTLFLVKIRTGTFRHVLRFSWKGFDPAVILWGIVLMISVSLIIEPLLNLFPAEWLEVVNDQVGRGGWGMLTVIVAAPLLEEIFFRGILQDSLIRKVGVWRGIIIASSIFGIIHFIPQQVVNAFCLGIVIGYIYYKTQSLIATIVLHAVNNSLSVFALIFQTDENKEMSVKAWINNDMVYYMIYGLALLLIVISVIKVIMAMHRANTIQTITD